MKKNGLLALSLSFCLFFPALAQIQTQTQTKPAAPPQKPADDQEEVVKITTNLVQVDAVVTKDGRMVTDLTADDFEIYEDGKKQTITSFAYISNVPGAIAPPITRTKEKPGDVPPAPRPINPNEPHRTLAFVVDDLGLSAESMHQVRRQLRKFINEQLQPNDVVAIIRTGGEVGALQQFTNDKRILNRAVEQLRWNICNRVGITVLAPLDSGNATPLCGRESIATTFRSLRFILDAMSYLPGRKSMVFMSDHMPIEDQDDLNFLRSVRAGAKDEDPLLSDNDKLSDSRFGAANYTAALRKLAEKAIRSSVVIYSVDTQGLQYTGITAADRFYGGGPQMQNVMRNRSVLLTSRREGGDLVAKQTGGFQVKNSNSFEIDRIVQDQSGYYLLGYRPTDETFNRKFHHIKAKVTRSGMTLRTRFGFFGVSEEEASKTRLTTRDMTNLALASPFAAQDIDVELASLFWSDKSAGPLVRSFFYIDPHDLQFTPVDGRQQASIEVHAAVFGDNGALIEQLKRGATISYSESEYAATLKNGIGLSVDVPVKRSGAFQVRIAVRDRKSSKIGSSGEFVTVPDLRNKRLAVSGIILGDGSGNEQDAMVNTIARRFGVNTDLAFAYVIYNALQFVKPVMETKLFRDGKVVYSGPEMAIQVAGQPDPDRVVVSSKVRLSPDLEPGYYYLQVVITDKEAKSKAPPVVQWIDFEIVKSQPAAAAPGLN